MNLYLNEILDVFLLELKDAASFNDLNRIKIKYLGRSGIINEKFKSIIILPHSEKIQAGKIINDIKQKISFYISEKILNFKENKISDVLDVTLPGVGVEYGSNHIITKTTEEIEFFFISLGFDVLNGFEIDTDYYNFEALNMSETHPSRNIHDTFYINNHQLLRTHTSNMQIHIMENKKPPFKVISCGKVYRRDSDISHTPMFHQVEGFVVDKDISVANLKFILSNFLDFFFKGKVNIRMRSSYFPFTEPSIEIDIQCVNCMGKKCSTCKYSGWIEVLGCGIIHPNVLSNCNINNNLYRGLAFGMGIERLSMIKYRIDDLRLYFENNIDFLKQF